MIETIALIAGYLASLLLAISLLVNNDLKFRWLNTLGCLAFVIYGILITALPVILTNSILLLINIIYLIKIHSTKENFDLLEIKPEDKIISKFLSFYKKDISVYFPDYNYSKDTHDISFIVLRDLVIANIFSANLLPDGTAVIYINYTVAKYRDFKVGKFIFDKEKQFLISKGVKRLAYKNVTNKQHEKFLQVMGFTKESSNTGYYMIKVLS